MAGIRIEAALSSNYLLPGIPHRLFLLAELVAPETGDRKGPVQNLGFVLDRSGSMHGAKLEYTKQAVNFALGHLGNTDIVSLVDFDNQVRVLFPADILSHRDGLRQAVDRIYPGGSTNLSGGMLTGFSEVKKNCRDGQVNRVLLLTDGQANNGITSHDALVAKARQMAEAGVNLSTFGLGDDFEEDLLIAMAEAGRGNFYYVDAPDKIPAIFEQELSGLLKVFAQNLQLKVTPAGGVKLVRALGYQFEGDANGIGVTLPDIYSGEGKIVLVELEVPPTAPGRIDLGELELSWVGVGEDLSLETVKVSFSLPVIAGPLTNEPMDNIDVTKHVELIRSAEIREEAIRKADEGDFAGGREILESRIQALHSMDKKYMSDEMQEDLKMMESSISILSHISYSKAARKDMKSTSYNRMKGRKK